MGLNITVDKDQLLEKLRANREEHREAFRLAMQGYLTAQKIELQKLLAQLEAGEEIDRYLRETPPEDHTKSYDEAIDMLEWATGNEVELTHAQFVQYVRDEWGWKGNWEVSNSAYITSATAR